MGISTKVSWEFILSIQMVECIVPDGIWMVNEEPVLLVTVMGNIINAKANVVIYVLGECFLRHECCLGSKALTYVPHFEPHLLECFHALICFNEEDCNASGHSQTSENRQENY